MTADRIIGTVRSHQGYDGFRGVLRSRAAELRLTRSLLNSISGLSYVDKILMDSGRKKPGKGQGPRRMNRGIGPTSLGPLLGVLGLKMVLVEDAEMLQQVMRCAKFPADANHKMLTTRKPRLHKFPKGPEFARLMRQRGIIKILPVRRIAIARKAAKARWKKHNS